MIAVCWVDIEIKNIDDVRNSVDPYCENIIVMKLEQLKNKFGEDFKFIGIAECADFATQEKLLGEGSKREYYLFDSSPDAVELEWRRSVLKQIRNKETKTLQTDK